jgi:ankyrin repeat protein
MNRDLEININVLNEELLWASMYGHLEVVKLLIENGADVRAKDGVALRLASRYGHLEVVRLLIENGAKNEQ